MKADKSFHIDCSYPCLSDFIRVKKRFPDTQKKMNMGPSA